MARDKDAHLDLTRTGQGLTQDWHKRAPYDNRCERHHDGGDDAHHSLARSTRERCGCHGNRGDERH